MKRILMTALVAVVAVIAFAANPLKVLSGDKKFFKTAEGGCLLEIVYEGASFDGKMPLTEKYSDIDAKAKVSYEGFVEEFSERINKVKIVKAVDNANYKMTIKVTKVDEFVNIMGFIPGPCIRVWGTLTITDIKGDTPLLVVNIDEIDGGSAVNVDRAFNDTFGELGKRIAKMK